MHYEKPNKKLQSVLTLPMHYEKPNKKLQSVLTPLIYLLYHKEASVEEIARQTEKNYSTILRVISQLSKSEFVKFRLERTAPRGKELRFYTITFDGLAFYYQWRHMLEHSVSEMRKVAKVHEDMLLVFKKWDKFALANCEEDMFTRVVSALILLNVRGIISSGFPRLGCIF